MAGEMQVELVPQGTLIERIRSGGYGLGGVLTQTGLGTTVEDGKQKVEIERQNLPARNCAARRFRAWYTHSLPIIWAISATRSRPVTSIRSWPWQADTVIACADNIVPVGVISPDHIMTPAPIVDYMVTNA